jgi:hypothetical protein
MIGIRIQSVDAVIATVAVSSVVTAFCGMVIVANVHDALHGTAASPSATEQATVSPAREPLVERRYPMPETAPGLAMPLGFEDPRPALQSIPERGSGEALLARLPQIHGPFSPETRTALAAALPVGETATASRAIPPELAATLRTPIARPAGFAALPPLDTAPAVAPSPLLVSLSPRPPARPGAAARVMAARAPAQPIAENIQVARAEAPEASLTPARLSEDPDRVRLFPPRAGSNPCSARLARAIPRRPGNAAPASAVLASLGNGSGSGRDNAIISEALRGNVPDHIRALQPVRFTGAVGGRQTEIVICVTPDYLAVGSNADHVRVPLGLPAALRLAESFDMMLPTTRMVDAIYAQADLRLSPRPMTPGPQMSSTDYFLRHDATLDAQMAQAGGRHGVLLAGHKKDLVLANRLSSNRGRVAIYGWHRSHGDPIQPLSTVHGEYYADYSHGIRLVSRTAYVDGRPVDLRGLLTDSVYAALLNSDGPLSSATVRLASL